jgi:hypothetical protein
MWRQVYRDFSDLSKAEQLALFDFSTIEILRAI